MKALPKRKGNCTPPRVPATLGGLNGSLHLKLQNKRSRGHPGPSQQPTFLKVSPKRKGNQAQQSCGATVGAGALLKALPERKGDR